MSLIPLASLLPESEGFYAILMGVGLILGVYAHAAKMPRLVAFAIMLVFMTTILTMVAAGAFTDGPPGVR